MDYNEFIEHIAVVAKEICPKYDLPPSVCIAQAILESGWGKYVIGNYNYFGRKWNGWGNYVEHVTGEYINGNYETIVDKFQSYDSLEEAIEDWCVLITEEPCYQDAYEIWKEEWNLTDFVYALAPVYATDPDYANKIMSTIKANDLMDYDT